MEKSASCCSSHKSHKRPFYGDKLFITLAVSLFLLLVSFFTPFLIPFRKVFLAYLEKIWLAVSVGLLLGGVIDYYIPREYLSKLLAGNKASVIFNSVLLGFLMSACSHGILALSIQLHKKGASNPAVVSFLLASPWANFTITLMLVGLFGIKGIFIIIAALIVAVNTGFIFMFLDKKGLIEKNRNTVEVGKDFSVLSDIKVRFRNYKFGLPALVADAKGMLKGAWALSEMVLWWIILGMLIASMLGAYIPEHFFHKFMGPDLLGLIVTMVIATLVEVCSEGTAPLAFEIYRQTHALGNSFAFLMAGVATDYTEIGLLWSNVGRRTAIWLPLIAVPQIMILGYIANIAFH